MPSWRRGTRAWDNDDDDGPEKEQGGRAPACKQGGTFNPERGEGRAGRGGGEGRTTHWPCSRWAATLVQTFQTRVSES